MKDYAKPNLKKSLLWENNLKKKMNVNFESITYFII